MNILDEGVHEDLRDPLVFGQSFQEEYCKALVMDEKGRQISEVDSGAGNSSCASNLEKSDDEDMLGCVFAFSEEGKLQKLVLHFFQVFCFLFIYLFTCG